MSDLNIFFDERKAELNLFTDFLTQVDNEPSFSEQLPIFKGQSILMLYNLIEGTVNRAITHIFDCVNDSNLFYQDLSDTFAKVWLLYQKLNEPSTAKGIMKLDKQLDKFKSYIHDPVEIDFGIFKDNHKAYLNSGALDCKKINETFELFNISFTHSEGKLREIKEERNQLAHGEKSFKEIGQIKSVPEIISNSLNVIIYLEKFIIEITTYINAASYKKLTGCC